MARYTGPVCKLCRREGVKLFLKAERCVTKCTLDKRPTPPGPQGTGKRNIGPPIMSHHMGLRLAQRLDPRRNILRQRGNAIVSV